jgi:hypothetical protein
MNHLLMGLDVPIPLLTRRQLYNHYVFPQPLRILGTEIVVGVQPKFVAADDHGDLIHMKSVLVLVTYTLAQCHHLGTCLKKNFVLKDLLFISFIKQYRLVDLPIEVSQARHSRPQTLTTNHQRMSLAEQ